MSLDVLIVKNISTTENLLNCRTILFFSMRFVWLLNARAPHRSNFYGTQLSILVYGWISKRERRILRIQILMISNTNGDIFNRWSLFTPGALKTDLLNFMGVLKPKTTVGAFHLAYIEEIPEARWWRFRSDSSVDSSGVDSMSQIKGDITWRTSKERYEQLILVL